MNINFSFTYPGKQIISDLRNVSDSIRTNIIKSIIDYRDSNIFILRRFKIPQEKMYKFCSAGDKLLAIVLSIDLENGQINPKLEVKDAIQDWVGDPTELAYIPSHRNFFVNRNIFTYNSVLIKLPIIVLNPVQLYPFNQSTLDWSVGFVIESQNFTVCEV